MRVIFMGTPAFAVPTLRKLLSSQHVVCRIFTQPDRPSGRGQKITASPIKRLALESQLPIHQPQELKSVEWKDLLEAIAADALVVVAYGKILPAWLFNLPCFGAINLHASLLPRYRGAAPIPWAIVYGETRTGVTTMRIDQGMDTGDLLLQQKVEIQSEETASELHDRLAMLGADLLIRTLDLLEKDQITATPQNSDLATYAPILKKSDGELNWEQSSREIYNRIRALNPWPGTYTYCRASMLRILNARPVNPPEDLKRVGSLCRRGSNGALVACGSGCLELLEVQVENHQRVPASDFLNGIRLQSNQSVTLGS